MHEQIYRGDVFSANLNPVIGSEQGGMRPVVVIQNDTGNKHSSTIIVAPITSKIKPQLPTHLPISGVTGLYEDSIVLLEQLRTIDKQRCGKKIGTLNPVALHMIDAALVVSLGIKQVKNEPMVMTLCSKCAQSFYDAGSYYVKRADHEQEVKESCTMCNVRSGYDCEVTRKKQ